MKLRLIDFGSVPPLRSQTLWHAIAHGVSNGGPPTLSFMRPGAPYVSIGYHRRYGEIDAAACAARDLPVFRRMVGGGPVYLDSAQLFFQITIPAGLATGSHRATMRKLLNPAVQAFRAAGVDAGLDDDGEVVAGDRKICGHAAGRIRDAVIVVGNLITGFDHEAAASTLQVPDPDIRPELVRLMRRYVAATPCDPGTFREAAAAAYGAALYLDFEYGYLSRDELTALDELDARFADSTWVRGDGGGPLEPWRVKIKSRVGMFSASQGDDRLTLSIRDGRVARAFLSGSSVNGAASAMAASLEGRDVAEVTGLLADYGPAGRAFAPLAAGATKAIG